jgi:hypothetical protein
MINDLLHDRGALDPPPGQLRQQQNDPTPPLWRQRLPNTRRQRFAHDATQASARRRKALGIRVSAIRRILAIYKRQLLWDIKTAFRDMKSPLAERPIFHHAERRTEAHIFLCVLAYHLLIAIEKTLLDQAIHTSWATVRDALKTHQVCTIVLPTADGSCLRIRKAATAEPDVQDLYRRLAISPQITKPQHSWSAAPA